MYVPNEYDLFFSTDKHILRHNNIIPTYVEPFDVQVKSNILFKIIFFIFIIYLIYRLSK